MEYETAEILKMKVAELLNQIKEADTKYLAWQRKGCDRLALLYKERLDKLFVELADANIAFIKNATTDYLNKVSICVMLSEMGVRYTKADGLIYLNG